MIMIMIIRRRRRTDSDDEGEDEEEDAGGVAHGVGVGASVLCGSASVRISGRCFTSLHFRSLFLFLPLFVSLFFSDGSFIFVRKRRRKRSRRRACLCVCSDADVRKYCSSRKMLLSKIAFDIAGNYPSKMFCLRAFHLTLPLPGYFSLPAQPAPRPASSPSSRRSGRTARARRFVFTRKRS